ncbi:glycosyltransferase family 4 protein [Streptomyces caniscabiei]|uniref:glycosyltransferase family 4 protein n=1 Tax=Streptomyces caniscabiei TaxID=2746961 RepID=UPI0029AD0D92|nr:glycosyltransferase family 4 protein [Streptomyces caniscabiei]MDX2776098.1 glycosyltransferase family 4 protein [Streptomyces caniscabiei]
MSDFPVDSPGGAQVSMANQIQSLKDAGHDVFLITPGKTPASPNDLVIHSFIPVKEKQITFRFVLPTAKVRRQIKAFLRENNIEIVHTQSELGLATMTRRVAQSLGIPVVATVHSFFWESSIRRGAMLLSFVLRLLYRLYNPRGVSIIPRRTNPLDAALCAVTLTHAQQVDYVISPSRHQKDAMIEAGLTTPSTVMVNPYVPPNAVPAPALVEKEEAHFVWIGRCSPEKRLLVFIDAVNKVSKTNPAKRWRVTVIGDGPDREKAEQMVDPAARVAFRGKLTHTEALQCMDDATMLVLTSYHFDNQPMVVAEACSRWRGMLYCDERLQEGLSESGLRTTSSTADAIAQRMQECIDDPSIARQFSVRARSAASLFLSATYIDTIVPLYEELR